MINVKFELPSQFQYFRFPPTNPPLAPSVFDFGFCYWVLPECITARFPDQCGGQLEQGSWSNMDNIRYVAGLSLSSLGLVRLTKFEACITATLAESTFIYTKDALNLTFTLAAAADNMDLFFRMSAPSKFSWIAVGTGDKMDGLMMFLAYPAADEKNVMLSARLDGNHDEPIYHDKINVSLISSPDQPNGIGAAHQILDLFILLAVIIQPIIGFLHHRICKTTLRATKRIELHK